MMKELSLKLPPHIAYDEVELKKFISSETGYEENRIDYLIRKRSIDARRKQIVINVTVDVFIDEKAPSLIPEQREYQDVSNRPVVLIVGAGPAGLFAALRAVELGFKPIVFERGKDVRERRRDLAAINKHDIVNPESNYCFGEGGAGTYSDGKLYTRSKKRGDIMRILEILVAHGARENILYEAHPHIGTNKLPPLVAELRNSILKAGGEIHFNTRVTDFIIDNERMRGVVTASGKSYEGIGVVLATGHSARDIFSILNNKGVDIEFKPFALGVRIEHEQTLIDSMQYNAKDRGEYLPPAAYSIKTQVDLKTGRYGVFSFCMCPGGFIVPSATAPGEQVVNGMSPSRRDGRYANSGMVVTVSDHDLDAYKEFGALKGMMFQAEVEKKAFESGGNTQKAPAQRMIDFVNKKTTASLKDTSYQPGLVSADLRDYLPEFVAESLRKGFLNFKRKMPSYFTNNAQLIGVESRTSSPVRIPRDKESLEHVRIRAFYPCGEGAGYAGGIMSAAMDGERCVEKLIESYGSK
ncbi:NAD(P)/FAD-dependent oxidoreductase [Marinigracilibium pacificum]|uniref:FAD-binding protein n=1 Tax=Marinigracilibium pacificum TaxID=2729599 RepID=A0A848IY60_9BACT|nr:FAD-binding protein [Marinigracilibium pacificum]NMM49227.1 FAD-binding protein [Marinigracilibium pacificum]